MTTRSDYRYQINGKISTDKTVMQNIESLASAAGCWVTYDIHDGKWSVIINQPGTSTASFNDSNIIGSINISGTSLTELYNSVRVEFPHIDLNNEPDYVGLTIPDEDRNDNEPDNQLNLQYDIIDDPVVAELLGLIELKQSRIDQIIQFRTDFSKFGLKAGDLIDVTSEVYGLTNQVYRIVSITEEDSDSGELILSITALQYDANVYETGDIYRYERNNSTGITTIGNIGIPGTPTVTLSNASNRPHITVESTAPIGVVEGMEFWLTNDVPPTVTVDSNRVYRLLQTITPTGNANVFSYGDQVQLDYDSLDNQNFLIKTRGINSITSGPYSTPSGSIYYAPEHISDIVNEATKVQNANGTSALINALGVATLINKLSGLFSSNSSAGGLFKQVFDVFNANTGYDIRQEAGNIQSTVTTVSYPGLMISAISGYQTTSGLAQTAAAQMGSTVTFTPPFNGTYKVDVIFDQNASGAKGGRGNDGGWGEPEDIIAVGAELSYAGNSTVITYPGSGGPGAQYWTDFAVTSVVSLSTSHSYNLKFYYTQQTASANTATASFDISYNVYSIAR